MPWGSPGDPLQDTVQAASQKLSEKRVDDLLDRVFLREAASGDHHSISRAAASKSAKDPVRSPARDIVRSNALTVAKGFR